MDFPVRHVQSPDDKWKIHGKWIDSDQFSLQTDQSPDQFSLQTPPPTHGSMAPRHIKRPFKLGLVTAAAPPRNAKDKAQRLGSAP